MEELKEKVQLRLADSEADTLGVVNSARKRLQFKPVGEDIDWKRFEKFPCNFKANALRGDKDLAEACEAVFKQLGFSYDAKSHVNNMYRLDPITDGCWRCGNVQDHRSYHKVDQCKLVRPPNRCQWCQKGSHAFAVCSIFVHICPHCQLRGHLFTHGCPDQGGLEEYKRRWEEIADEHNLAKQRHKYPKLGIFQFSVLSQLHRSVLPKYADLIVLPMPEAMSHVRFMDHKGRMVTEHYLRRVGTRHGERASGSGREARKENCDSRR